MTLPTPTLKADPTRPEGVMLHWAETEGVPDAGPNYLDLPFIYAGISPDLIREATIAVFAFPITNPNNPSVTGVFAVPHPNPVTPGSPLSASLDQIALHFIQAGADQVYVSIELIHTLGK